MNGLRLHTVPPSTIETLAPEPSTPPGIARPSRVRREPGTTSPQELGQVPRHQRKRAVDPSHRHRARRALGLRAPADHARGTSGGAQWMRISFERMQSTIASPPVTTVPGNRIELTISI